MYKKLTATSLLFMSLVSSVSAFELRYAQTLAGKGVIAEKSNVSEYRLEDTITRKEMMKIVMKLSGKAVADACNGDFSDVSNDWGCKYIEAALKNNFVAKNENFRPEETITKAESVKLILKARGIEKSVNTTDWQADWMNTAHDAGLLSKKYTDHNTEAKRGWIFELAATQKSFSPADIHKLISDESNVGSKKGSYTDYIEGLVGTTGTTVLFFNASWCPSCRAADANLAEDNIEKTNITLLKVDYDSNIDLRKKYGVTTQHTFVQVDAQGELITKWSGSNDLAAIEGKIQ